VLVLGLTSGLSSLGYSVLSTTPSHLDQIDCDLLAGSRMASSSIWTRCNAHRLILTVILERHPPTVLALGPPVERGEPPEFVTEMRLMMRSIAALIRVPVVEYSEEESVITALDFGAARSRAKRRLNGLVAHHLGMRHSTNRRIVLATATALAAAFTMNKRRSATTGAPL